MPLGTSLLSNSPFGKVFSYKVFPLFAYIICNWEACIHFSREGGHYLFLGFCKKIIFHRKGSFQRSEFLGGNFTLGEFARIPIRNSSYVLLSPCRLNITCGDLKGNCPG